MSKSKQKGTKFETEVVNHLHAKGLDLTHRQVLTGNIDIGDIGGIPGWVIECKNVNSASWAAWMDETEVERRNAGAEFGLLVVRRRMAAIEKAYAVLPLSQAIRLIIDDIESR
jgi:hypothetical protein